MQIRLVRQHFQNEQQQKAMSKSEMIMKQNDIRHPVASSVANKGFVVSCLVFFFLGLFTCYFYFVGRGLLH